MAGQFIIPIGADTTQFEKALSNIESKVYSISANMEKYSKKGVADWTKTVKDGTKEYVGTIERLSDSMNSLVAVTKKLETSSGAVGKAGRAAAAEMYNEWAPMRKQLQGATIDFEKIYQLQQKLGNLKKKSVGLGSIDAETMQNLEKIVTKASESFNKRVKTWIKKANEMPVTNVDELEAKLAKLEKKKRSYDKKNFDEARQASKLLQTEINNTARAIERLNNINKNRKLETEISGIISKPATSKNDYYQRKKQLEELAKQYQGNSDIEVKAQKRIQNELQRTQSKIDSLNQKKGHLVSMAQRLAKYMAAAFGLQQIRSFLTEIVTVGGELQKQRVALGAIVQDISKANILFSQLKVQALESPFSFKELIDGTRQLAAYNIENEKLYKTQFMLSELSAGLGVEMNRLVLAYGQVKAAAVLRGQELRQFTEAGIPIIQALADKFTVLEGRVVSTGEVFDRVSNRMVSFQMVDEVLQDLVKEGGKFYQMQAKQAETVAGQFVNIRDAYEVMLLDIADSNEGFLLEMLRFVRWLINNWRILTNAILVGTAAYAAFQAATIFNTRAAVIWQRHLNSEIKITTALQLLQAKREKALMVLNTAKRGALIAMGALSVGWIVQQITATVKLNKEIEKIGQTQSEAYTSGAHHLQGLINKMSKAKEGTNEYKKAKDELIQQYGEYFPRIIKETDGVKELSAMYDQATESMRAFYAQRAQKEAVETIQSGSSYQRERKFTENIFTRVLRDDVSIPKDKANSIAKSIFKEIEIAVLSGVPMKEINFDEMVVGFIENMGIGIESSKAKQTLETEARKYAWQVYRTFSDVNEQLPGAMNFKNPVLASVSANINKTIETLKTNIEKDENKIDFLKILEIDEIEKDKQVTKVREQLATAIQGILGSQGKTLTTDDYNRIFAGEILSFPGLPQGSQDKIKEQFKGANERIEQYKNSLSNVNSITLQYFKRVADGLNKQYAGNKKLTEEEKKKLEIQDNAAENVWNLVKGYQSMEDVATGKELLESRAQAVEYAKQELKTIQATVPFDFTRIALTKEKLSQNEAQLKLLQDYHALYGVKADDKQTQTATGENPEIERANRLISIYRELESAYKKYIEYKDVDYAKTQSINELQEEYNALNKEMGGRLGNLSAITSQAELKSLIDSARSIFRSSDAQKILRAASIRESGGIAFEESKKSFEQQKASLEKLAESLQPEFDSTTAIASLQAFIDNVNKITGSDAEKQFAIELQVKVDKYKAERAVYEINEAVSKAQTAYSIGNEISAIKSETGLDVAIPGIKALNFDEYIKELETQLAAFREEAAKGNAEAQKAASSLSMEITTLNANELKTKLIETSRMRYQIMTDEEKAGQKKLQADILAIEIESLDAKIAVADEEAKEKLRIDREYLQARLELINQEMSSLESEAFRMSQAYMVVYGDIERYGRNTYNSMLTNLKAAAEGARKAGSVNGKYSFMGFDGKQIEVAEKDMGKFLVDIDKRFADLAKKNPFQSFKDDISAISEGGKFNIDKLGSALGTLSTSLQGLDELFGIFGASQQTQDIIGGSVDALSAAGEIAMNPYNVGAYVKLFQSIIKIGDADNVARIKEHEKAIKSLTKSYEELSDALSDTAGADQYQQTFNQMNALLAEQERRYWEMANEERRKKQSDEDAIQDYTDKARDVAKQRQDLIKNTIKEFSTDMESLAGAFTDAWMSAFEETGDGLSGLEDAFDDMMRNVIKKQIQAQYMEKIVQPFLKQLNDAVDPTGDDGIMINEKEAMAIRNSMTNVRFGAEQANEFMENIFKMLGLEPGGASKFDTLQKGIQGITENSAQIIASYLNSVRLEVVTIRKILEMGAGVPQNASRASSDITTQTYNLMNTYYPQYLDNIIAIRQNTAYLKDAYDAGARGFRVS